MCGLTVSGPFSDDLKIAFLPDSDASPLELVSYFESPLHWEGEARPRAFLEGAELNPHVPENGGKCLGPVRKTRPRSCTRCERRVFCILRQNLLHFVIHFFFRVLLDVPLSYFVILSLLRQSCLAASYVAGTVAARMRHAARSPGLLDAT